MDWDGVMVGFTEEPRALCSAEGGVDEGSISFSLEDEMSA